ncbi:MAG TPA: hypothetical protein ENI59_02535 [Euryarchaeota archaeon]|nr:hypothetical protein [Euryarchaeota archaeon]
MLENNKFAELLVATAKFIFNNPISKFLLPIFFYAVFLIILYNYRYELFLNTVILVGTYVFTPLGLEISVPLGITKLGLHPGYLVGVLLFTDVIVSLFIIWNLPTLKKIPGIGKIISKIERKGKKTFEKSKKIAGATFFALMIFVAVPFQGTGAIGGSIIGTLIGFPPKYIVLAVVMGTLLRLTLYTLVVLGVIHVFL